MYDDYPTIYETALNQNLILLIIFACFSVFFLIITFISLAKIFKKANRSGITAIIPIYNIITLLEITDSSKWYLLFLIIPGVNIVFYSFLMISLAKTFRKSKKFALGLIFLPFVFYPILAFGKSEYIGINLSAMEGKSFATDIPKPENKEESNPVIHEEKDTSLKNIDISIGGGVYQKDYANTLLQVDQSQAIINKNSFNNNEISDNALNNDLKSLNTFITSNKEEDNIKEDLWNISNNFESIFNSIEENNDCVKNDFQPSVNNIQNPQLGSLENTATNKQELTNQNYFTNTQSNSSVNLEIPTSEGQNNYKTEFISCPKCGATIKSDSKVCFLCGRLLDGQMKN